MNSYEHLHNVDNGVDGTNPASAEKSMPHSTVSLMTVVL